MVEKSHSKIVKLSSEEKQFFVKAGLKAPEAMPQDQYMCHTYEQKLQAKNKSRESKKEEAAKKKDFEKKKNLL